MWLKRSHWQFPGSSVWKLVYFILYLNWVIFFFFFNTGTDLPMTEKLSYTHTLEVPTSVPPGWKSCWEASMYLSNNGDERQASRQNSSFREQSNWPCSNRELGTWIGWVNTTNKEPCWPWNCFPYHNWAWKIICSPTYCWIQPLAI